jgi:hypothetical protein
LSGASSLDPPVKPGGDKKNAPSVKALWARYQTFSSRCSRSHELITR